MEIFNNLAIIPLLAYLAQHPFIDPFVVFLDTAVTHGGGRFSAG